MPDLKALENRIFNISSSDSFNELAIDIFHLQYKNNKVYHDFVDYIGIKPSSVNHYLKIPFLPIEFFKDQKIVTGDFKEETVFTSSGTTGQNPSRHYIKSLDLYQQSFILNFKQQFGKVEDYIILALLPSYLEQGSSSLVYMVRKLIKKTHDPKSGFYLHEYKKLAQILSGLMSTSKKVLLIGVSYALLDLADKHSVHFPELTLMETGGMKGRRKELVRAEFHNILKNAFGIKNVCSEYGMTELLSQAYSHTNGIFQTPTWMKILIRDLNDPLSIIPVSKTGGINIIDLANIYSCSFIATKDLGEKINDSTFKMLGRYDNSDVRGCNLMIS